MPKPNDHAAAIIRRIEYATLATVDESGHPWNAPVYFACDSHFNIYWGSHTGSQHSQNLQLNAQVFIVIYDSTVPAGTGEGVYIQAHATRISDPHDVVNAHHLIQERRNPVPYWKLEQCLPGSPVSLYNAVPLNIWTNSDSQADGIYIDVRSPAQT